MNEANIQPSSSVNDLLEILTRRTDKLGNLDQERYNPGQNRNRRLELVVEERTGARAGDCLLLARPFFLVPSTSKRLRRLGENKTEQQTPIPPNQG